MEDTQPTKRCSKCGVVKCLSEFSKQKSQKDGHKHRCKACDKAYQTRYYAENRDHLLQQSAEYAKARPEIGVRSQRKYYTTHTEAILRRAKARDLEHPEIRAAARRRTKKARPEHVLFVQTRSRAKQSGIPFTIEETDLSIPEICPILGIPLKWKEKSRSPNTPSIDRIVPGLGYVKGNIAVISWRANRLKNDGTADELRRIADWIDSQLVH